MAAPQGFWRALATPLVSGTSIVAPMTEFKNSSAREKKTHTRGKIFERVCEKSGLLGKNVNNACMKMILHL